MAVFSNTVLPHGVSRFALAPSARTFMSATTLNVNDGGVGEGRGWVAPKVPVSTITSFGQELGIGELQVTLYVYTMFQ